MGSLKCGSFDLAENATECDLSRKGIMPGAATLLAGVLKFNTRLTHLSLGGNNLTNDGEDMSGLLKLVEVLPQTKIESLSLGWNRIGDEGVTKLAKVLSQTKITTLDL